MEREYTLQEAEQASNIPRATLRRWLESGKIEGKQVQKKTRLAWVISEAQLQKLKNEHIAIQEDSSYKALKLEWQECLKSGFHSDKPVTQNTIDNYNYGMDSFWRFLGLSESIDLITIENLRLALANVVTEKQAKTETDACFYGIRHQVYKGFRSFYQFLARKGLKPVQPLDEMKFFKPKRQTPARRTFLYVSQVDEILKTNSTWNGGRGEDGILLTETIFMLGVYAGLRNREIRELKLSDINFPSGVLSVESKGKKRDVPMEPKLEKQLKKWIAQRPKSKEPYLLVQRTGKALTKRVVARRINNLGKKVGVDLTPHGLRRTAGGRWEQLLGLSMTEIKEMYGHSDIGITQIYIPKDKKTMIEKVRRGVQPPAKNKTRKPKSKSRY